MSVKLLLTTTLMKPSYFVSRLLRPLFALSLAFTLASATWAEASTKSETETSTLTSAQTIEDTQSIIESNIKITLEGPAITINGGSLGEMTGDIEVSVDFGDSVGIETIKGGYLGEMSGNITITYNGAESDNAVGVWINGISSSTNTSSVGTISGDITVNGGVAESYGIYLYGDSETYAGGNELGYVADTSEILVSTTSGTAYGIKNFYGDITSVDGSIKATSETGSVRALDNWGSMETVSATLTAIQTESADADDVTVVGLYNRSNGVVGAIDLVTSAIYAESVNTNSYGINNVGIITELAAEVKAVSDSGRATAVYNLGCAISYAAGYGIVDMTGKYEASSTDGFALALENRAKIDSIEAELIAHSDNTGSFGVYNYDPTTYTGTASIESIAGSITTTSTNSYSYGIVNLSSIGDVSATIKTTAGGNAYGIYNGGAADAVITTVSGEITAKSDDGDAFGIQNSGALGDVSSDITATGETYAAAIYNYVYTTEDEDGVELVVSTGAITDISGTLIATSIAGFADGIANYASITDISDADITVKAEFDEALGIRNWGDIASVSADITATGAKYTAAIYNDYDAEIGNVSGTLIATSTALEANGIDNRSIMGNVDVVITATGDTGAYGIYSVGTVGTISGDITVIAGSGQAYGLSNSDEGASMGAVTANLTVTGEAAAFGLYNLGVVSSMDGVIRSTSISENAYGVYNLGGEITGSVSGAIYSISESAVAYGVSNSGTIGDVTCDITSTGATSSYGIFNRYSETSLSYGSSGGISGDITVSAGSGDAYGVYNATDCEVDGEVSATIIATSDESGAFGIRNHGDMGDISADITAKGDSDTYGIYNGSAGEGIGKITSVISSSSVNGDAYGVSNWGTVTSISSDITAFSEDGKSYGISNNGTINGTVSGEIISTSESSNAYGISISSGTMGTISGDITATGATGAYGIYSYKGTVGDIGSDIVATTGTGTAYGIYSYYKGTVGDIIGDITVSSGTGIAYGVYSYYSGVVGDVSGDITATGVTDAYGIHSTGTMGVISGSITASAGTGTAYGVSTTSTEALSFGDSVSISATSDSGDAYSLYSSATSMTIESEGVLSLTGDVKVSSSGTGSLTISDGWVGMIEGSTIIADSITIDSDATLSFVISADDSITSSSLTGTGTLVLSAGADLGDVFAYDFSSSDDFTSVADTVKVVTYGGTLEDNIFTINVIKDAITLDAKEEETGVVVTNNARLEVSDENNETTIVMNFNTAGSDASADATTAVYAVTTVTTVLQITTEVQVTESFETFVTTTTTDTIIAAEAYYFDVDLSADDSVQLVFDIGEDLDVNEIVVYHLADGTYSWSDAEIIDDFTYDGRYLYVMVDDFSAYGYAVKSGAVPEPTTTTLSLLALAALCARRKRSKLA